MSEEPVRPAPSPQPNRDLLLAQALDACIEAEREVPGSAEEIIQRQPTWAQVELRRLVDLAGSLDAAATNAIMSEDFRVSARARLMQRISRDLDDEVTPRLAPMPLPGARLAAVPPTNAYHRPRPRRARRWFWRGTACLVAAVLATAATLTASASALPGEPLYGIKQAQEELGVRLANDDQARAVALLNLADARLDETARLLRLGRADEAAAAAQRFDESVMRATATYVVTIDDAPTTPPVAAHLDTRLVQQQEQLQLLLNAAPEAARTEIREALVTTERSRALVADPVPVERALGRSDHESAVAAPALEQVPTLVPTRVPTPAPTPVVAVRHDELVSPVVRPPERRNDDEDGGRTPNRGDGNGDGDDRDEEQTALAAVPTGPIVTTTSISRGRSERQAATPAPDDDAHHDAGDDDADTRVPTAVPAFAARGGDGTHEPDVALRGDPPRGTANTQSGNGRGRDVETPQQTTPVAHTEDGDARARGRSADAPAATTTTTATQAGRPAVQAPAVAVTTQNEREGSNNRGGEGRAAPTSAPAQVGRPAASPTPARAQRGGGGGDNAAERNASPTRPTSGDGGRGAGGDH
jgi:hypothetical protein